ncbi:LysM peptidoglycan-binding domain-containing protein [Paenibacillus sanguinis]|uniref:LysM peptidoglycan-binding domain-containing protein n=1 Tax=Paenibacillus sanguinis TaxID=225906 RepID=UPI000379D13C|nr:LysM peptidoglycan-binding domain-containing protein [Paenibacillus sanguinis]
MADQSYGLRFDIYERVHLSEEVIGIEELEEIELYPKIQVMPGDEYAALRGHLLLTGSYLGEGEKRELEHYIPVEITIPLSRVNRLEDITVEIENFDVDLLSSRSLNITGVLSLQGIETSTLLSESHSWKDREFTTAHVVRGEEDDAEDGLEAETSSSLLADEDRSGSPLGWEEADTEIYSESSEHEEQSAPALSTAPWQAFPEERLPSQAPTGDEQQELSWSDDIAGFQNTAAWADKEYEAAEERDEKADSHVWFKGEAHTYGDIRHAQSDTEAQQNAGYADDVQEAGTLPDEVLAEDDYALEASSQGITEEYSDPPTEEKQEMKIALGAKKNGSSDSEGFGLTKLLSSSSRLAEEGEADEEDLADEAGAEVGEGEELRWKNLFIQSEDQTPFRKVKLVIVQREETLDDIAERYHLSSRELQLYNRLSEHELAEGQILYIP